MSTLKQTTTPRVLNCISWQAKKGQRESSKADAKGLSKHSFPVGFYVF